jgi:hypothetical protein
MESEEEKKEPEIKTPSISEQLINTLIENYATEGNPADINLKTTMDIMEEMAPVFDVEKWQIALSLQKAGFKITYTNAGPFWMLFKH